MSNKLRPCPFCGKETAEVECDGAFWWVKCQSCGASGHVYWFTLNNGNARDIVIDNWNARPIEDALNARIAELEGFIGKLIEVGNGMKSFLTPYVDGFRDSYPATSAWESLVKDWKEG